MSKDLISTVKEALIDKIKHQMADAWVNRHQTEIQVEVDQRIAKEEKARAQGVFEEAKKRREQEELQYQKDKASYDRLNNRYETLQQEFQKSLKAYNEAQNRQENSFLQRSHPPRQPTEPQRPQEPSTKEMFGYQIPVNRIMDVELSRYNKGKIKEQFEKIYRDNFITTRWNGFKKALQMQIERLKPQALLDTLFQRHPWLATEQNFVEKSGAVYSFLDKLLWDHLLSLLDSDNANAWDKLSKDQLVKDLHWKPQGIEKEWLKNHIESFPLSNINQFFIESSCHAHPTLSLRRDWLNHAFSRVDVFRILNSIYIKSLALRSFAFPQKPGLCGTLVAPVIHNELQHLPPEQLKKFETLVVNVGSENDPLWIVVNKEKGKWIAYVPRTQVDFAKTLKTLANLELKIVDYADNSSLNDLKTEAKSQWHAVAFGRIMPWCAQKLNETTGMELSQYRHNVPLSLLLQTTLEGCLLTSIGTKMRYELVNHFVNRCPITEKGIYEPKFDGDEHVAYDPKTFIYKINTAEMLLAFDEASFKISPDLKKLVIAGNAPVEAKKMVQAVNLLYHNPSLSYLEFPPIEGDLANAPDLPELFNLDTHLRAIKPSAVFSEHPGSYFAPFHCAARNRFLAKIDPDWLKQAEASPAERRLLWDHTGQKLEEFFQSHGQNLDLDFINEVNKFNRTWTEIYCDHAAEKDIDPTVWTFVQISQMGSKGIQVFFEQLNKKYAARWNSLYKEPAPALQATFDVSSSLTTKPVDYISQLTLAIRNFGKNGCAPLFDKLSLILSDKFEETEKDALFTLVKILNQRKKTHTSEIEEINLYHLDIDNPNAKSLLLKWYASAIKENLFVLPRIPAWDRASYHDKKQREVKAIYRKLQNQVKENQRQRQLSEIQKNTQSIYKLVVEKSQRPELIKQDQDSNRLASEPQPWDGEDVVYPLSAQAPGIQQQLQQQVEQQIEMEVKQEEQVEQEYEYEQEQQVAVYGRDERDLITRDTINGNEIANQYWQATDAARKELSGWQVDWSLQRLFSLWVGSEVDAPNVIEKIEPQALQKMMQYPAQFRLGIHKDNLPPGFSIQFSRQGGLILCFSNKREKEDLLHRQKLASEEKADPKTKNRRNPFTVELHSPLEARLFQGDFYQFDPLSIAVTDRDEHRKANQTLYKYLATEDNDKVRIANALEICPPETVEEDASVAEQHWNIKGEIVKPGDYQDCLAILKQWATKISPCDGIEVASKELINFLFNSEQGTSLTELNLKGFGQLFNEADSISPKTKRLSTFNATEHWLFIANQIHSNFGVESLTIWKQRLLDPSNNWTELLTEKEVGAITESIKLLKGNSIAQKVWWKLVDAHGKATGHMRYSELWDAYKIVFNYLKKNNLEFDLTSINKYLDQAENFNGQVFLDRLYRVLKIAANEPQIRNSILANIVQHIDKIDWRHNGFYYASRYEKIPQWHENLNLHDFLPTIQPSKPSYQVVWDNEEITVTDLKTHALRFAVQQLRFDQDELTQLKAISDSAFTNDKAPLGRLFIACLTLGSEKIDSFAPEKVETLMVRLEENSDPQLIAWLNRHLILEGNRNNRLALRFEDIEIFARTIKALNLQDKLTQLSSEDGFKFINDCGRALQCYKKYFPEQRESYFQGLLQMACQTGLRPHLGSTYPWLIEEVVTDDDLQDYSNWKKVDPLAVSLKLLGDSVTALEKRPWLKEVDNFSKQLQSIDSASSTFWPDRKELTEAFSRITTAKDPIETRKSIVKAWCTQGCQIVNQNGMAFRNSADDEIKIAKKEMGKKISGIFTEQNAALLDKLFKNAIAVEVEGDHSRLIKQFINLLASIDNKNHYNELGQILGLLLTKAKQSDGAYRHYSLPQLFEWLTAIALPADQAKIQHYGVALLNEVLEESIKQESQGLLSNNLQHLKAEPNSGLLQKLTEISHAVLPNQHKPALVKMAIACEKRNNLSFVGDAKKLLVKCYANNISPSWLTAISDLLIYFSKQLSQSDENAAHCMFVCQALAAQLNQANFPGVIQSEGMAKLWQKNQLKFINWIQKDEFNWKKRFFLEFKTAKHVYLTSILTQCISNWDKQKSSFTDLYYSNLNAWSEAELAKLAEYYSTDPHPSLELLDNLTKTHKSAEALIHEFETVFQGLKEDGTPKRHYSPTPEDRDSLNRVLKGFKRKGEGFIADSERKKLLNLFELINSYSEAAQLALTRSEELTQLLHLDLKQSRDETLSELQREQATARVLACMREILLRKSGKWANHTQMLDLLYAALHNDESMLHQVRTGQGKSIVTVMRAAYLALNGYVVDVFSAKESLSHRDHEEFAPILEAMGISHSFIPAAGPSSLYKTQSDNPQIGAVNYATMGNFSLFQSNHIWAGKDKISLDVKNRVAFIDEADHVLTDEQTQFNHTDSKENDGIYNLDEWVYRVAYRFYVDRKDSLPKTEQGIPLISRNKDLRELCQRIQSEAKYGPKESRFLQKYLTPALTGSPEAIAKRDQQLKLLLTAAHTAAGLKENSQFCLRESVQSVPGGNIILTRCAKVMIDNQLMEGSTYSDLVQQFLHVRLNEEAIAKGEAPNFFIEPESHIALSQNASYLLKKYYHKIEGCTGTAGNVADLKEYEETYGIDHIIKLPTHETVKTEFLPPIYTEDGDNQAKKIAQKIIENANSRNPQPILITCEDDIEVKAIAKKVREKLQNLEQDSLLAKITVDTNDTGKREADIVPSAGHEGAITISARLGRGTDIKPKSPRGLMVLRTYPTNPRIEKQERGRQGRNGAQGTCQDIIDFSKVRKEHDRFLRFNGERYSPLYEEQSQHFTEKLDRNRQNGSKKWEWAQHNAVASESYVITRAVQQFKLELKRKGEKYIRQKEYLIATLSGDVMDVLHQHMGSRSIQLDATELQEDWLECRKNIEADWNNRLAGKDTDTDEIYQQFSIQANSHWQNLCNKYNVLSRDIVLGLYTNAEKDPIAPLKNEADKLMRKLDKVDVLNSQQREELSELYKRVKKLTLRYHPDKHSDGSEEQKAASSKLEEVLKLRDLLEDYRTRRASSFQAPEKTDDTLVPHLNPQPLEEGTTQKEMNAVIEFYQQWVRGTQTCYFGQAPINPALISSIYGQNKELLMALFSSVYQASIYNKSAALDSFAQRLRRQAFFTKLRRLFKDNPAAYCISCQGLANAIALLSTQENNQEDANHFSCLEEFFKQEWLESNYPIDFAPDDIAKHDRLLQLTLSIVTRRFVDTGEKETFAFIHNLGSAIRAHFWANFDDDLAEEIKSVFASNATVVELLMKSANEADIAYFINLIKNNMSAPNKERNKTKLVNYLTEKVTELDKLRGVIRPIFQMALSEARNGTGENYLPQNPKILAKIDDPQVQNDSWNFLAQRASNSRTQAETLIKRLANQPDDPAFIETVLKPLFKLPPHLPLAFINTYIANVPGKYHWSDYPQVIQTLKTVGQQFNQFLLRNGVITSTDSYSVSENRRTEFEEWVNQLTKMPIASGELFFKLAKKASPVPLACVKILAEQFTDKLINEHEVKAFLIRLTNLCSNVEQINGLNSETKADLFRGLEKQFSLDKQRAMAISNEFIHCTLEAQKKASLAEETIIFLGNTFADALINEDSQLSDIVLALTKHAAILPVMNILSSFDAHLANKEATLQKFNGFASSIAAQQSVLSQACSTVLYEAYEKAYEEILDEQELSEQFSELVGLANRLPISVVEILAAKFSQGETTLSSLQQVSDLYANIQKIKDLDPDEQTKTEISNQFQNGLSRPVNTVIQGLDDFVGCIIKAQKTVSFKAETLAALYNAFSTGKIVGKRQINKAINVVKLGLELEEKGNYSRLFTPVVCEERQTLMQHLEHNILDLGETFKERLYTEYNNFAISLVDDLPASKYSNAKKRGQGMTRIHNAYRKILSFAQELVVVSKWPSSRSVDEVSPDTTDLNELKSDHKLYFEKQSKNYASFWGKNKLRKSQANLLFTSLENSVLDGELRGDKGVYYLELLKIIGDIQRQILTEDIGTKHNKKGYSRLYDITQQMFAKLARDCLADKEVTVQQKRRIATLLNQKLHSNFDTLIERLPVGHELRSKLETLQTKAADPATFLSSGTVEASKLREILCDKNIHKTVPKRLNYLIENLRGLVSVQRSGCENAQTIPTERYVAGG